jgi:hypothetical protein
MKRMFLLLVAAMLAAAPIPSDAAGRHNSYVTINDATDVWMWTTLYNTNGTIRAQLCISPGHRYYGAYRDTNVGEVKVQAKTKDCQWAVPAPIFIASLNARGNGGDTDSVTNFLSEVSGKPGHYLFRRV